MNSTSSPSCNEIILVVDDVPDTLEVIERNLSSHGYHVYTAESAPEAIDILEERSIDLVITDLKMPKVSGMELIRHIRENFENTEVMMITGFASIRGAVDALKNGAEEYLPKPFTDEELLSAVRGVFDRLHLLRSGRIKVKGKPRSRGGLLGDSRALTMVLSAMAKASSSSATVLISGESGTGKELVARGIHYDSQRASAPFIPINCGGIPEGLLESELFGYVKGAFTGAQESRAGFFLTAEGGTIFLDEISETSASMQIKLLRVLQDKEICMVGANRPRKVDMRIIAATNKDLLGMVNKGLFRDDLYYRLNVISITVPPLRERDNDILLLARYFAAKFSKERGNPPPIFSHATLDALKNYSWPGNVRELENLMQRLVIMSDAPVINVTDLPSPLRFSAKRERTSLRSLAEMELEHIHKVLASVEGNKSRAARILDIDRKTLREKIKKLDS